MSIEIIRKCVYAWGLSGLAMLAISGERTVVAADRPNIVFILMDDFRLRRHGCLWMQGYSELLISTVWPGKESGSPISTPTAPSVPHSLWFITGRWQAALRVRMGYGLFSRIVLATRR